MYYASSSCASTPEFSVKLLEDVPYEERDKCALKIHHNTFWCCITRPTSSEATVLLNNDSLRKTNEHIMRIGAVVEILYPGLPDPVNLIYDKVDLLSLLAKRENKEHLKMVIGPSMTDGFKVLDLIHNHFVETKSILESERQTYREEIEILKNQLGLRGKELEQAKLSDQVSFSHKVAPINDQLHSIISQLQPLQMNVAALHHECQKIDKNKVTVITCMTKEIEELKPQLDKLQSELARHTTESIRLRDDLKDCTQKSLNTKKEFNSKKEALEKEINQLKPQVDNLQVELSRKSTLSIRLQEELKERREEFAVMKTSFSKEKSSFGETLFKEKSSYLEVWNQLAQLKKKLKQNFSKELECVICHEIGKSPATLNCGHTFCSHCINTWKATKMECPTCRKPIVQQVPNLALKNIFESFKEEIFD